LNKKHQQQMKGNTSFLILIAISFCSYAQKAKPKVVYETIIVYDTITVYDTVFVYDTIKTDKKVQSENNFKNNFTAEKAYLAIDTSNFSAAVLLINKKDTATLSINSIILSETNKNLDTMKKSLLTLLVSAALTQAASAQTRKADTLSSPKTFSIGAGLCYSGEGAGAMVKADYLKTKKLSFGVRASVNSIKWDDYSLPGSTTPGNEYPGFTANSKMGYHANAFLTSTYYLGKRGYSSKAGLYLSAGLGYESFSMSRTVTYTDNKFDHDRKSSWGVLSGLICLGGDYKLGPGKLFFDIPLGISIYSKGKDEIVYKAMSPSNETLVWSGFGPNLSSMNINLGYTFYF
jgi:hypothetical protein